MWWVGPVFEWVNGQEKLTAVEEAGKRSLLGCVGSWVSISLWSKSVPRTHCSLMILTIVHSSSWGISMVVFKIPLLYLSPPSGRNPTQLWLHSLAAAHSCPVQPVCVCPILLALSRNPFKSSALYLCVWPFSKLAPNLLPYCPLVSIPLCWKITSLHPNLSLWCHISGPHPLPEFEH